MIRFDSKKNLSFFFNSLSQLSKTLQSYRGKKKGMFKRQKPTTPTAGHGCYPPTVLRKKPAVAEKSDGDVVESNVNFFAADLPYDVKERRVVEHRLRTPHRRFSSGDMKKVIQHWVDLPVGKLLWRVCKGSSVVVNARSNGIMKTVSKVVTKAQKEKEAKECTNLRALIVPDLDEDEGKTMLKRITLIAAGSDGCVSAYGGCVPTSRCLTTKGCVAALAELVKEQSGADLTPYDWVKVTEVHYTDSPNTIFFAPILKASPSPVFSPQVEAGVDGQPDQYVVTPLKLPLASIAEFQVCYKIIRQILPLFFGPGLDLKLHPGVRSSRNSMKVLTARTDVSYLRDYKTGGEEGYAGRFCAFRVFLFFSNPASPISPVHSLCLSVGVCGTSPSPQGLNAPALFYASSPWQGI